jgi:hypothetical protein
LPFKYTTCSAYTMVGLHSSLNPAVTLWCALWFTVVGLCRLNQVDPYPITYSLSNP